MFWTWALAQVCLLAQQLRSYVSLLFRWRKLRVQDKRSSVQRMPACHVHTASSCIRAFLATIATGDLWLILACMPCLLFPCTGTQCHHYHEPIPVVSVTVVSAVPPSSHLRLSLLPFFPTAAGIVGISAACLGAHVMLTDTRDILPQIMENVEQNGELVEAAGGSATVQELDWNAPDDEVRQAGAAGRHCYAVQS